MHTRLRALAPVFASLLLLAACDKKEEKKADAKTDKAEKQAEQPAKKADEPAKAEPEPTKAADVLTLGAAKLKAKDKPEEVIDIAADGTVSFAGETIMKLSADGKFSKPDGTVLGQVGADGVVTIDGKPVGVTLVEGGATVTTPDGKTATIGFAADGAMTIEPKPEKESPDEMTSEGCTGPVAKTCALVMMTFLLRGESAPEQPAKVEAATVEAKPAAG
jgi:hypothetical protein